MHLFFKNKIFIRKLRSIYSTFKTFKATFVSLKPNVMEVYINDVAIELDREMIKISDLLGYVGIKRLPNMTVSVNGKPVRNTLWIKFPILDGDQLKVASSEEVVIKTRK